MSKFTDGKYDPLINAAGSFVGTGLSQGMSSTAGDIFSGLGNIASAIPGPWGAVASAGLQTLGGVTNALWGSSINEGAVEGAKSANELQANTRFGFSGTDDITSQGLTMLGSISKKDIGKEGLFSNKVTNLTKDLNAQRDMANKQMLANFDMAADNVDKRNDFNALMNYAALGGPLHSYGTEWTNGIREINTGNTHEKNPLGGVPMGVAEDGQPNLVEEGEVIFNDYVFSNRLKVPKSVRDKYKLKGVKEMTFADAAKQAQKESEERPNDPISKRGLEDIMNKLTAAQEMLKEKRNKRQYAKGGLLGRKYDGLEPYSNFLSGVSIWPSWNEGNPLYDNTIKYFPNKTSITVPFDKPQLYVPNKDIANLKFNLSDYTLPTTIEGLNYKGKGTLDKNKKGIDNLRYAPAIGNAAMALRDMFVKPDYSNAKAIEDAANLAGTYTPVRFRTIGDYMKYTPMDRLFYANQLGAQAGATRRSILNNSGGNRGTAIAHLLAADYNAQNALGNLFRQADEADLKERQLVADFNRSTNLANSQGILQAAMANQNARQHALATRLGGIDSARKFREAIDSARGQSISTNLTTMFDNLGDIGRQEFTKAMIDNNRYLLYDSLGRYKGDVLDDLYKPKSKGGFLTIKSKRRR